MYFIIYKTTNTINGKIYIGKHKTNNLDDGYLGSGKLLNRAIKKYSIESFKREILYICETEEHMNSIEKELVTEEFCLRNDTYNLCVGGHGGFSYINRLGLNYTLEKNKSISLFRDAEFIKNNKEAQVKNGLRGSNARSKLVKEGIIDPRTFLGKTHTADTKQKMSLIKKGKQTGIKNSQYGSMWITNGTENKKISKEDLVPDKWYKGRTLK